MNAMPVLRGCGTRKKGGVYAECGMSPYGRPVEDYLLDPVVPLDPASIGLTAIGQVLKPAEYMDDGTTLASPPIIFDWIGQTHYYHPTDYIEEIRRFGLSTRLSLPLKAITGLKDARIVPVHARAALTVDKRTVSHVGYNGETLASDVLYTPTIEDLILAYHRPCNVPPVDLSWERCPRDFEHPLDVWFHCAGWLWQSLPTVPGWPEQVIKRGGPSFDYFGYAEIPGMQFEPAMFASFPITRLVVVNDPDDLDGIDKKANAINTPGNPPVMIVGE